MPIRQLKARAPAIKIGAMSIVPMLALSLSAPLVGTDSSESDQVQRVVSSRSASSEVSSAQSGQIPLTGDVNVHDPTLYSDANTYYVSGTGGIIRSAPSLQGPWTILGRVPKADWADDVSPGNLWAPHVVKNGDTYYYYYAQSAGSGRRSAIGLKTTKTPGDPSSYVDYGEPIIGPTVKQPPFSPWPKPNGYNAIDPNVYQDEDGEFWIVWGSHFDGIAIQRLADDMATTLGPPKKVAARGNTQFPCVPNVPGTTYTTQCLMENPAIFRHGDYYYYLASWDWCCAHEAQSTYKVIVGRSRNIDGPYVDQSGQPLTEGGGTMILNDRTTQPGVTPEGFYGAPGGEDVFQENDTDYMIYHADVPETRMGIRPIDWYGGWPYFNEPGGGPYDLQPGAYYRLVNQEGMPGGEGPSGPSPPYADPDALQNPEASNRCLTAAGDGEELNAIQAECDDNSSRQAWQLQQAPDGFHRLSMVAADGRSHCLTLDQDQIRRQPDHLKERDGVVHGTGIPGTNVVISPCLDDDVLQQWYFGDTGHGFHRLVVRQANLALEVENVNGVVGTNVVGGFRHDGMHWPTEAGNMTHSGKWPPQQWQLTVVPSPSP